MEWLNHLNQAIAYMEQCLDRECSMEEAARIACCSPDYFRRMFGYVVGVSPAEYLQRRRMTQAAFLLQHTDKTVLEVALRYGYASPAAFDRAFRQVHGLTPTEARRAGSPLHAWLPVRLSVQVAGGRPLAYRIEQKTALRIAGVHIRLEAGNLEQVQRAVPAFWQRTLHGAGFSTLCGPDGEKAGRIFGVSDCRDAHSGAYWIGTEAEGEGPAPAGRTVCEIPAACWVVFETTGAYREAVQEVFRRFFTEWLPFSGWRYAGGPDVEVYPAGQPEAGRAEVWFAVEQEGTE